MRNQKTYVSLRTNNNIITTTSNKINKVKAFAEKLKSKSTKRNWKGKFFKKDSVICNQFKNKILRNHKIVCSFFYQTNSV